MANELTKKQESDITESEMAKVHQYMEDGLPGIAQVTNTQLYRMYELYLTGSSYSQISVALRLKKVIVHYMSYKSGWFASKQEYINELMENNKTKVVESKIRSKDFMLLLVQAWQKKIGNKLTAYLGTDEIKHMDGIDLKEVAQLMRAIEMVNDLDNTGKDSKGKPSPIGLNMGNSGVTIEKTGDNKLTITPNEVPIGDILKKYADAHHEEEKKRLSSPEKHDINNEQGEKNEK